MRIAATVTEKTYRTCFSPDGDMTVPDMYTTHEPDSDDLFAWLRGHGLRCIETSVESNPAYLTETGWHGIAIRKEERP